MDAQMLDGGRATCVSCGQRMENGAGCHCNVYVGEDTEIVLPRIPATKDQMSPNECSDMFGHCHDCGVTAGQYHHPGCDVERCPMHGGQMICCPGCIADELYWDGGQMAFDSTGMFGRLVRPGSVPTANASLGHEYRPSAYYDPFPGDV